MPFLPNIPAPTNTLTQSQSDLLNNFQILGAIAGNGNPSSDSINTGVGAGLPSGFNWIYLPSNGPAAGNAPPPGAQFPAGQNGIYSATNANTGRSEIYVNKTLASGLTQVPMTAYRLGGTNAGNGWTYLPSGLKMAWGRSTTGAGTSVNVIYSAELTNFPGFTTANNIPQLTRIAGVGATSNFVKLTAYNQTQFTAASSLATAGTAIQFSWFVIGA